MHTILIGSVAQNLQKYNSDIDIVRIDNYNDIEREESWPNGPINYIDYTIDEFSKLYDSGSLFILHILRDGVLLQGDELEWKKYVRNFVFIDTYGEELNTLEALFHQVSNVSIYGGTFLSFYSNLFLLIKNYAIFKLAHQGTFEFNKEVAYKNVFGSEYYELLSSAYNIYIRNEELLLDSFDFESIDLTENVIKHFNKLIEVK